MDVSTFALSPDGKAPAVASDQCGGQYGSRLHVVNADGSGLSAVPGIRTAVAPAWRPEWLGSREHSGPRGSARPTPQD